MLLAKSIVKLKGFWWFPANSHVLGLAIGRMVLSIQGWTKIHNTSPGAGVQGRTKEAFIEEMPREGAMKSCKPTLSDQGPDFCFLLIKRCQETCDLMPKTGK